MPSAHTHTYISDVRMCPVIPRYNCTCCYHGELEVTAWVSRVVMVLGTHGLAVKCWFCKQSREVDGYIQRVYIHP